MFKLIFRMGIVGINFLKRSTLILGKFIQFYHLLKVQFESFLHFNLKLPIILNVVILIY